MHERKASCLARASWLALLVNCTSSGGADPSGSHEIGANTIDSPELGSGNSAPGLFVPGVVGGQSGGEGVHACKITEQPFETAEEPRVRLNVAKESRDLAQDLSTRMALGWRPATAQPNPIPNTLLSFTDFQFGETATVGCNTFSVAVSFQVRSEDGHLDAKFMGTIRRKGYYEYEIAATLTDGKLSHPLVLPDASAAGRIQLLLVAKEGLPHLHGNLTAAGSRVLAELSPSGAEGSIERVINSVQPDQLSNLQREACKSAQPTAQALWPFGDAGINAPNAIVDPQSIVSPPALLPSLSGPWLVCSGHSDREASFAGLAIDPTGHYHELKVVNDKLVAVQGFGHEGGFAGSLQGSFVAWQLRAPMELAFSADHRTLQIRGDYDDQWVEDKAVDLTFQASDLPIQYPPLAFERDARAGLSACMGGEADVRPPAQSESELLTLLYGRWLFCNGRLGQPAEYAGIAFLPDGRFHWLDREGNPIDRDAGTFGIEDRGPYTGGMYVRLVLPSLPYAGVDPGGMDAGVRNFVMFRPDFSRRPLKMHAHDAFQTILTAF